MALTITSRTVSGIVILDLAGRLSVLELSLRERINAHLNEGRCKFLLNLAAVTYIDSCGLGQLVTIWTSIEKKGGAMKLAAPAERVRALFTITKLDTVFPIYANETDALMQFPG